MPFYTFECPTCKHQVDVLQKMDDPAPVCNKCTRMVPRNIVEMKRILKPCGFNLKGGGWHKSDYNQFGPKAPEIEITQKKKK